MHDIPKMVAEHWMLVVGTASVNYDNTKQVNYVWCKALAILLDAVIANETGQPWCMASWVSSMEMGD